MRITSWLSFLANDSRWGGGEQRKKMERSRMLKRIRGGISDLRGMGVAMAALPPNLPDRFDFCLEEIWTN